ncbi:MAG TPA: RNA polymerase sigma factor [Candidatus Paceibacterota bacterium]|nr:RNA polymerase sigma factor [Verrucomicrobiota bacterium]HRY48822.1 RNA polymerase sigma factor [Candidatus Paceibacterota bacterium]
METTLPILDAADAQTVAAVRLGNCERYRELIERYERRVFAVAWARLGDPDLAEEATQEAFIRGYRHLALLGQGGRFAAWITAIARNTAINLGLRRRHELRKRERWALENLPAQSPLESNDPKEEPISAETLRTTMAGLPNHHRECLTLYYLEGRSIADAAQTLGLTETAFKTRLHRARNALRTRLESVLEESLKQLGPRRTLAPAIMALLVASRAEAAAAGIGGGGVLLKVASGLAKIVPFQFLLVLFWCASQIPGLLLMLWLGRLDQRNYRDPQGFRARLYREGFNRMLVIFPVLTIAIWLMVHWLVQASGWEGYGRVLGLLFTGVLAQQARLLVINRTRFFVGQFVALVLMIIGWMGLGFLGFPSWAFSFFFGAFLILMTWAMKYRPQRMDYSLFLRFAQGTLPPLPPTGLPEHKLNRTLTADELLGFARFLGERWLVCDYRRGVEGLRLRLTAVKPNKFADLISMFWGRSSILAVDNDGSVRVFLGGPDAQQLAEIQNPNGSAPDHLEEGVARVVKMSLTHYLDRDVASAEHALGELETETIFVEAPEHSRATRWRVRIMAGCVTLWIVLMLLARWADYKKSTTPPRNLQPASITESQIRSTLARLGQDRDREAAAWREWDQGTFMPFSLPPKRLFTSQAWQNVITPLFGPQTTGLEPSIQDPQKLHRTLLSPFGTGTLSKAVLSGLITMDDLTSCGITKESMRRYLQQLPPGEFDELTQLREVQVRGQNYTFLLVDVFSSNLRLLALFDCLDLVDPVPATAWLRAHQVLEGNTMEGRMPLTDRREVHGLFHCMNEPLRDTYNALTVLSLLGGLDQIDRAACRDGLLRLHRGKGFFRLEPHRNPGLVIFGWARETAFAFESLRMLDALDHVKDLDQWVFLSPAINRDPTEDGMRLIGLMEIEAWIYQQRLEIILENRRQDPQRPVVSLFAPDFRSGIAASQSHLVPRSGTSSNEAAPQIYDRGQGVMKELHVMDRFETQLR